MAIFIVPGGTGGGGGTPGGSDTQVQFNDAGVFGGDSGLVFNKTTNKLTTGGDIELNDGGSFVTTIQTVTPTANRVLSFPDATGTIALVGGSSSQLVYNASGALAGISTLTYDGTTLTTAGRFVNSYTSLASSPAKAFTGSWFTGGSATTTKPHLLIEPSGTTSTAWSTSGTGLGVNAASGFAGNLLDLQVNGSPYLQISPNAFTALRFNAYNFYIGTDLQFGFTNGAFQLESPAVIQWSSTTSSNGAPDLTVLRDAANTLAQRNSTNAQTFRVYNTFTDASNYERHTHSWSGNVLNIANEAAGTGTLRSIAFSANGAASTPPVAFTGTWFTGGTATSTKPHLLIEPSGTTSTAWSTSGTGLGVNAASGFAGNLLDLQVAGVSQARINSDGWLQLGASAVVARATTGGGLRLGGSGVEVGIKAAGVTVPETAAYYAWANEANNPVISLALYRDAANTLAQRNSTNAQTFRVYNTYTDGSNYERHTHSWSGNVLNIANEAAGTGTLRSIAFSANGAASTPPVAFTGTWFTGGSATTTKPHLLIEPSGTTSTAWSTSGTGLGVNAASGFAGNLIDLQVNGVRRVAASDTAISLNPSAAGGATIGMGFGGSNWMLFDYNIQALQVNQTLELVNRNIKLSTSTGTKIGTATTQKLAFYNATPVVQPAAVADATDAASVITQLNLLLSRLRDLGLIAT